MLLKAEINMFLLSLERFLSDIRGPRYLHLIKVYFFVGHPVYGTDIGEIYATFGTYMAYI